MWVEVERNTHAVNGGYYLLEEYMTSKELKHAAVTTFNNFKISFPIEETVHAKEAFMMI